MSNECQGPSRSRMLHQLAHATVVATAVALSAGCGGLTDDPPAPQARAAAPSVAGGPRDTGVAVPQRAPDDTTLADQVALLRREVADLRVQVAHLPGARQAEADGPRRLPSPEANAEAEQAERMRMASSESAFRNEPEDTRWSRGAVESVRGVFLQGEAGQRDDLRNVECRSRSCRVELGADPARGGAGDVSGRMLQLAQTFPNVLVGQVDQGDGRKATVLYLSR